MNAPDRSQTVREITLGEASLPFASEDARRGFLLNTLIPRLKQADHGGWGWLVKTDQGNKIPADIIVWRETMEHFDVLTDSGPMWEAKGIVTNPKWKVGPIDSSPLPPTPPTIPVPIPDPTPDPGTTFDQIIAQLNNIADQNAVLTNYVVMLTQVLADELGKIGVRQDRPLVGGNWRTGGLEFTPRS